MPAFLPLSELAARLGAPSGAEEYSPLSGAACVIVELDEDSVPSMPQPNCPVIAVTEREDVPAVVDVAVPSRAEAEAVSAAIAKQPVAAAVLVGLLRHNERVDVADGLFAESLAYSSLQHGAGFRSWLKQRTKRPPKPEPDSPPVRAERDGDELAITLQRPHKRNAYSAALRDALCEALAVAVADPSIRRVAFSGAGACFSAGGDLDEFGEATDAGVAHVSRMTRGAGVLLHRLSDKVEAHLHGACIGAGIELPAFAGRVVARQDAFFQLPEVGMGLIPGAGGTVSIPLRIGRRRLAYMALTGARIDVETAFAWGLVDSIAA